jgi:hypothetical protein
MPPHAFSIAAARTANGVSSDQTQNAIGSSARP